MSNPHETLAAGRLIARQRTPYFRAVLLGLAPVEAPGLGTVGVTEHGVLMWDPEYVAKLTAEEMAADLIHEVMHVVLKHCTSFRTAGRDKRLLNMAQDLAINPAVVDMGYKFAGGDLKALYPEDFRDEHGKPFERGLTADEYYELLRRQAAAQGAGQGQGGGKRGKGKGGAAAGGEAPPQGEGGEGEGTPQLGGKPGTGRGWCGSCAAHELPNEPDAKHPGSRAQGELERLGRQVAEAVREASSKSRGTIPAMLQRWADQILKPAKVPWTTKLQHVTRAACAWRDGAVQHRYDAPGRRQAGIGFGPGCPVLPRFRTPVPNVAVIIDTSGSMGTKELSDAASEVNGVLRSVGAAVDFVACDAAVHAYRKVKDVKEALAMLKGGGGTDMRPAFAALEKGRPRPDVIICMTDGYLGDGYPPVPPRGTKVIWLIVGSCTAACAPYGETIFIDTPAAQAEAESAA